MRRSKELFPGWIEAVATFNVSQEFLTPVPESEPEPLPFGMYYSDPNTLANPTLEALEQQYGQPIPVSELDIQPGNAFDVALQTYIATATWVRTRANGRSICMMLVDSYMRFSSKCFAPTRICPNRLGDCYISTGEQSTFGFPDPTGSAPERALQNFIDSFS